jgi:hypothetical protein
MLKQIFFSRDHTQTTCVHLVMGEGEKAKEKMKRMKKRRRKKYKDNEE